MAPLILIVDDEKDLVNAVEFHLQREGFRTAAAFDAGGALSLTEREVPDLIILDVMLPDLPGTEVCRRLRARPATNKTPILMLTARTEEIDRVVGFEVGADDYMVKPFSMRELVLRIRAILRRSHEEEPPLGQRLEAGPIRMDVEAHRAFVNGKEVRLTALEFRLLQLFLERQGRVQTRDMLLHDVWGIEAEITTRTVDTHVKRLREKLGPAGDCVETIRGVGYRFVAAPGGPAE